MTDQYLAISQACSELITRSYSTSFSAGIRMLEPCFRGPVYAVYGFVRLSDEIVDSFLTGDRKTLLDHFCADTRRAIRDGVSLNPVLHSFQQVVREYGIEQELIEAFWKSMYMDLNQSAYSRENYESYIYGSAEVVGLMCLRIFCKGQPGLFDALREPARSLGAAFQKVNFLRDLKADYEVLGRIYFPGLQLDPFTAEAKQAIEAEIEIDFRRGLGGIQQLPRGSRQGVQLAYRYYYALFLRIRKKSPSGIREARVRISNLQKAWIYLGCMLRSPFSRP